MSQTDETPTSGGDTPQWRLAVPPRDLSGASLGDFQVERLIGRGGMGEVYLARQISLNRSVALKVLRPELLSQPILLGRFEAEATAVAKLNHPNIVHIYTLGATDGGIRFIAMEYVQGTNLREYIKKKGALDYALALSIMRQAGVAVGAAGEIGLIHRDIKPENLLLTKKGQVKVADFGLCRDLDSERVNLTQTGNTMGTPMYMSPEQAQGLALDHRSDLYSLGVTFYHMIAGVPPFRAETPLALALKHVKDRPASLAVHRPDVPPELDRLVLKLMAKSPGDRYQSAAEMLRDLARVRESLNAPSGVQPVVDVPGSTATDLPLAAAATDRGATPSVSALRTMFLAPDTSSPRFGRKAGLALVTVGLLAGGAAGWLHRPDDLLASTAKEPQVMPGLWINPLWQGVETRATAEDQYLYAQIRAPVEGREAAWLAVPGFFPANREWAPRAYAQLARLLLLRLDAERLGVLADELDRWEGGQTYAKVLAQVIRAGVKALNNDLEGVLADFEARVGPAKLNDPALLELSLQVADLADRIASQPGSSGGGGPARQKLRAIRLRVMEKLSTTEVRGALLNHPRPG